ncbi:chaperone modulator CbpM [Aegicerativicinus sediminis]|uniref:chaperone modulator CbpM n=1 Tax=Aegicerativicinus sediminis TaxID=2893202 RepID=UPI001E4BD6F9|nr:chaperone modulator CbpM [Aegicerativicinus sediminis]
MKTSRYIRIQELCSGYQLEEQYIFTLRDFGLLHIEEDDNEYVLPESDLPRFEKILNFHNDLNINMEGIEVIMNLLERIENLNQDLVSLRRKLKLYE